MQNTYQEKILDLENTNNSINKKLEGGIKFKIKVHKPIHFSNEDTIENITNELNKILEKMILTSPNNWIWSHNRWK